MELTVIIPNYNKAKYIRKCIESIENQTYKSYQILIVDDFSTDDSRSIIKELSEQYGNISYIFLEENGGVSNARNIGLEKADTEYVTYIDSDDYYAIDSKLENEMNLLLSSKNPQKTMAYSIIQLVDEDGNAITGELSKGDHIYIYGKHQLADLISMKKLMVGPRDYCISKESLVRVGAYSFEKNLYEDLDLLMRLAVDGIDFACTDRLGTAYRQNTGGLSGAARKEHKETRKKIRDSYWNYLSGYEKIYVYVTKIRIFIYECIRGIIRRLRIRRV